MARSYNNATPVAYEQITVSTSAVGFTQATCIPTTGTPASYAVVRVSTNNVRWRDDGVDPTASVGMPLNAGEILEYDANLKHMKFIRSGSADATLDVTYYAVGV